MNIGGNEPSDVSAELEALRLELKHCRRALELCRSSEQLVRRLISVRSEVSFALSKPAPIQKMMGECAEAIVRNLDAAFARIWTLNARQNVLELQASSGLYTRLDGEYSRIPFGDLKIGWIAQEKKPHLTNAVLSDPHILNKEWARECGLVSFAGYPLIVEGRLVGVMAMFARQTLADATLDTLAAMADVIAQGIERKRAEEELRLEKTRFEGILDIAEDAIISANSDHQIVFFNRGAQKIFGYGPVEVIGKPLDMLLPNQFSSAHRGHFEAFGRSPKDSRVMRQCGEIYGVRKDQTEFPVEASISKLSLGAETHVTVILRDITERKKAETALQKSENQFRTIVDTIPAMICTLNPVGQVELLSRQVLEYFGKTAEDLKNWAMTDAVHPDDLPWVIERLKRSLESGEPYDSELRQRRADGIYRWQQSRARPVRDENGKITGWYVLITDIDDRRQAEAALRRSQAYLTEAQHLSRTGSFGWKPATGELIWSDETFRIMGYDPASRPTVEMVFDRVHPQDLSLLKETMAGAVRGLSEFELEHRLLFADGLIKHVHVVARCVKDGAGDLEYVGALMDITEQKRLENQLRSSERNLAEGQRLTKTGSWILDYKTGNTDWSVETCRIFGFPDPPPSPHYREFRARIRFEDREGVDRGLQESFERGEPRPLKYVFILPDGTRKNIETISEPVRDESGKVVKLMGTVMDVTERQTAEDALRASELLARGQIDALTRALDVMARESAPDKIVEQVLRSFTTQLEAHSSSVWRRDEASGLMIFEFALEEGDFRTKANAQLARIGATLRIEDVWLWPEIFRTGKPHRLEDIREESEFPWRANLLAQGVVSVLTVPMLISGLVVGVIDIRFTSKRAFRREEMELAQALTNQVTLATQLIRLSEQSREAAVIAERNRMARDIHDALAQGFTGVIVQLEAAEDAASKGLTAEARNHLARAGKMARYGLSEARRSVRALRLQGLEEGDLCSALDALFRTMTTDTSLHSEFALRGVPQSLPPEWEENLLRIAQEVVTNALRHGHATHFKARLHFEAQRLSLELRDDGCGFDPELKRDGFGLVGMRERVDQMGGHIVIQSAQGAGTTIEITLALTGNSQPSES